MGAVSKDEPLAEKEAAHDASANEQSAPDFDQLVSYLGQFGKYQKWLFFLLWVPAACMSISVYSSVFVEFRPSHHCKTSTCLVDQLSNLADPSCTLPIVANDSVCQVEDWSNVRTCDEYAYDTSLFTRYVSNQLFVYNMLVKHIVEILQFSITQILREINFGDSRSAKSAIFTHLEAPNLSFQ